jgi:hypothetical protein
MSPDHQAGTSGLREDHRIQLDSGEMDVPMSAPIYISFAGSDETNGDYSRLRNFAASGGSTTWSSLKGVRPGEKVLIHLLSQRA